ncbi:MAG: hypothetical protein ACD_66C00109G0004 [uncultured bacterium]|uniref:Small ribosomal subunit protein bS20 n=1 Tax=Candidatus Uhrbacteria bacterium GW2011_GWC1_41_20 TaxID=1618983 RepID=A0A0G0VDG1_9BACT|nr:MAG: hypothetical protein ACD_66C00109G0004 [uncultured bacterium]KKR22459.1 MAG: 30S ribosomal protein S20 [Candidatus Uhrbacteria bacterium GW2011_GWE1_39_46]KKR63824.1 MAG: 30S ribosomal protein S20 [Candidatus Uhrbacteria bacterium GW2011_GWC2_40_450]KKR89945.1 MAG: 30S ribosomal protein S20 [Candidatus Uhrbacteria bacterium GW2011_GWD2_41_121]KKR95819.1 MAG: 30S ribosomal protein S20 [Candidatus Uhrbacteria bacterium GW2011_GWD1_41_16]KKR98929.1 MAG: 30S ribosomal protein S20 [Candidat
MPNLANAKKALRQSQKRAELNKVQKAELESLRRLLRKAATAKKIEEVQATLPKIYKLADKMVNKNIIKKNKAARIKARSAMVSKKAQ